MDPAEAARINNRYSAFYLVRYSPTTARFIQIGKSRSTIERALADAARLDGANPKWMTFVDVVQPAR